MASAPKISGPFKYYQPPTAKQSPPEKLRTFSERAGDEQPEELWQDKDDQDNPLGIHASAYDGFKEAAAEQYARGQRINIVTDDVPTNLRSKPWSPEPRSPKSQPPQRHASNASAPLRKGSVSERSPLQKLESNFIDKEQKRARAEQAERRAQPDSPGLLTADRGVARTMTLNREKGRVVSDGNRRPSEPSRRTEERPRQSSAGNNISDAEVGRDKFARASDALKKETSPPLQPGAFPTVRAPPIANDQRAYQKQAPVKDDALDRSASERKRQSFQDDTPSPNSYSKYEGAAARGKMAHERRKSQLQDSAQIPTPPAQQGNSASRGNTRARPPAEGGDEPLYVRQNAQNDRQSSTTREGGRMRAFNPTAALPQTQYSHQPEYKQSPVRDPQPAAAGAVGGEEKHGLKDFFHHKPDQPRPYVPTVQPLEEWRKAATVRLTADDLDLDPPGLMAGSAEKDNAWWEKNKRDSGSTRRTSAMYDGPYEEEAKQYRPQLFTTCGPLLRFTGIRNEKTRPSTSGQARSRDIWRGSVLLVTDDVRSDYSSTPILRIFAQPMDLHSPQTRHAELGQEMLPEHEDPIAGQVKLSRTGRPLYVRPVHDLAGEMDLSREENPRGLYSAMRTPVLGPQSVAGPDGRQSAHITFQDKSRVKRNSGEKTGRYREVKATRLHVENGWTFWRFNLEIELGSKQHRVAYRINKGPAIGFWVPGRDETMNMMFHSCNGFSLGVERPDTFCGPDPLWRDVLNKHQSKPFHVMIGGGDQIYNDAATRETQMFREWTLTKNPNQKYEADFSPELQSELEQFYLERYAMWFSQGLFAMANSQIPMVNLWDDHDLIDGYGSYPHHFMSSAVLSGLGAVAFKYYMLFQHQSVVAETDKEEPSWLLGRTPGPYIHERSRNVFLKVGQRVAFLGLDCRTERMRDEILSQETYDDIFDMLRHEIVKGETRHLIVLLGVPIAYPRLNFLENILTSRLMDPIKAVGRTGALGGFVNKFDGGVEILDDLDDHWTAKHHKAERNWLIQELQELAAEYSVRVTILGGDVHLAAVGQFYTPKKFGIPKDKDHRYMPNVISSAIVNTPPPVMMADVLNRRNKVHHLDTETDEDMIPMFDTDVDGSKRNNKHLLPRRNYCTISEYQPGTTPPSSPKLGAQPFATDEPDRRFPPGSMRRTMSLSHNPATNLVRRLSNSARGRKESNSVPASPGFPPPMQRSNSLGGPPTFNQEPQAPGSAPPERRPSFHRRPTNLSEKQAKKAAAFAGEDGREPGHVDLEYGLDISLNVEHDQRDPSGSTVPYRLLVPALWYDGAADVNTLQLKGRRPSIVQRLGLNWPKKQQQAEDDYSPPESPIVQANTAYNARAPQAQTYDGAYDNYDRSAELREDPRNSSAWKEGFKLSGPPLGARAIQAEQGPPKADPVQPVGPYGYHRSSAPQQKRRSARFEDDEPSLTEESLLSQEQAPPIRRPSKVERVLGLADDQGGNARRSMQEDRRFSFAGDEDEKKVPAWKIWKR